MVVMNKEVGFESDYSRHFRFSDLGAAQTTFEGREYFTRTGLQQGWREILTSFARLLWRISKVIPSVKILEFSRSSQWMRMALSFLVIRCKWHLGRYCGRRRRTQALESEDSNPMVCCCLWNLLTSLNVTFLLCRMGRFIGLK